MIRNKTTSQRLQKLSYTTRTTTSFTTRHDYDDFNESCVELLGDFLPHPPSQQKTMPGLAFAPVWARRLTTASTLGMGICPYG